MRANQQQQIADALSVLPKLGRGLDVNVKFQKVTDFEFNQELSVFDMLGINLLHGWLYDPQDTETAELIKGLSYNQLITLLVDADTAGQPDPAQAVPGPQSDGADRTPAPPPPPPAAGAGTGGVGWTAMPSVVSWAPGHVRGSSSWVPFPGDEAPPPLPPPPHQQQQQQPPAAAGAGGREEAVQAMVRRGRRIEQFLQDSASQLTFFGLAQLHEGLREGELCVFFRNNHFSTMCKHKRELYLLCTDVGYFDQPNIVWERLGDVSGDNAYCGPDFRPYTAPSRSPARPSAPAAPITMDHLQSVLSSIAGGGPQPPSTAPPDRRSAGRGASGAGGGGAGGGGPVAYSSGDRAYSSGAMARASAEQEDADLALAMHLQAQFEEEEKRRAAPAAAPQTLGTGPGPAAGRGGGTSAAARQRAGRGSAAEQEQVAQYQAEQRARHHQQQQQQQQHQQQQQVYAPAAPPRPDAPPAARPPKKKSDCAVQ